MTVPESIEWYIWRPVFSDHVKHVSKHEIDTCWSIIDLLECHELIDIHEELDRRAAMKSKAASGKG